MDLNRKLVILAAAVAYVSSAVMDIGCDPGWQINGGSCYFVDDKHQVTWSEALNECNRYDSSPIFFELPQELAFFRNLSQQYSPAAYWTSMNDIANGDQTAPGTTWWMWGSHEYINSDLVTWSTSPANDGHPACGGVNQQGKMYDADCNSKQGYICMIDNGVTTQGGCPMGWLNTDTDCYFLSNTTDPSQLLSWRDAAAKCVSMNSNAHLFVIDDVNDQNFLMSQLPYVSMTTYLHWTGLQGNGQAGGWKWNNGAALNTQLFSWAVEPDGVAGKENCAVIRRNGKFSDRGCNMKQNYMCRKPQMSIDTSFNLGCGLWTRAGQMCYQFYTAPTSTWSDAKQLCQSFQGDLINVADIDTKSWLSEQLMDPANGHIYWTALNDRDTEGVYKWGDGSTYDPNTITWNQEPNDWMGSEDCAFIYVSGEYNDVSCSYHAAPLCELDNVPSCPSTVGTWLSRTADSGSGQNCYLFGIYSNTSVLMTQQEASDYCTSLSYQTVNPAGATQTFIPTLFAVNTQAEADFITQQLQKYQDNQYGFWTSLNDKLNEGFWIFGNDLSSDTSFVNWRGEPNSATADTDCVAVATGANFYVRKCGLSYPFICERLANLPWGASAASPMSSSVAVLLFALIVHHLR